MARISKTTKKLLWAIVGLLIIVAVLGVVGRVTGIFGGGTDAVAVETETAMIRNITQVVTASGKIQPETDVLISPDVSGEIIQLTVKEGDKVERGVLLARIKPDFYLTQVEQAEAGVLQARATQAQRRADLMKAESDLRRQESLFAKAAISESEVEQARSLVEVSRAALEGAEFAVQSAQARLREAEEQVSKTAIYAPMAGTVSKLDVELGERVVGTSQMAGTEMMRIARLNQMEVEVEVNENEIVNVVPGDTASIEVDSYPERTFQGVVTEIANSARTTSAGTQEQVTSFPVKVRILDPHNLDVDVAEQPSLRSDEVPLPDNGSARFRPGMSATVDIFTDTVMDAVVVPIQAVTVRDFAALAAMDQPNDSSGAAEETEPRVTENSASGETSQVQKEDMRKVVFVVEDGSARMLEVATGISDETHIEVRTGMEGNETVIIGPYRAVSRTLNPGDKVETRGDHQGGPPFVATRQ